MFFFPISDVNATKKKPVISWIILISCILIFIYQKILKMFPSINLIASGGITSIDDVTELKRINIKESIVGKAIYEKKITLSELNNAY